MDGRRSRAVVVQKVASLRHEFWNDAMECGVAIPIITFRGGEIMNKIFDGAWDYVGA